MKYDIRRESKPNDVGVGYIVRCKLKESKGLIYGARGFGFGQSQLENKTLIKLFFFEKDNFIEYPPYTVVAFLQNYDSVEATNVIPLDDFIIYNENAAMDYQVRKDGCRHSDLEWNLMIEAKPYTIINENYLCVRLPCIFEEEKKVEYYHYFHSNWKGKDRATCLLSVFYTIKHYWCYKDFVPVACMEKKIKEIRQYVEHFDIIDESRKFIAGKMGWFQSYPGKDDSFFVKSYKRTSSKDAYIINLVKLEEKLDYYYNLNGRGLDDEDYDNIDEEKTAILRNEVKEAYSKNAHYFYLVREFISSVELKHQSFEYANKLRNKLIDPQDEHLFHDSKAKGKDYIYAFNKRCHSVSITR